MRIAAGVQWSDDATTHGLTQFLDGVGKVIGELVDNIVVVVGCWYGLNVAGEGRKKKCC